MSGNTQKKFKKHLKRYLLPLLLIALVVITILFELFFNHNITAPAEYAIKDATSRLQVLISEPISKIRIFWNSHLFSKDLREENQILKMQLAQLRKEITAYREALIENRRLKQLLEMKRKQSSRTVVGRIIGADPVSSVKILTLDIGRSDGVLEKMPVLSQSGLVGRIIETGFHYSKVMLITDYSSRVAVMVQRNRARAILEGQGRSLCKLKYVEKDVDIQKGDTIITSGLDGIFPKGLLIGEVASVNEDVSDLFQNILVKPSTDLDQLEEVLVLLETQKRDKNR